MRRRRRVADTPCAPRVQVDGRSMLAFCSNDYLGLAAHPRLDAPLAAAAAIHLDFTSLPVWPGAITI